LSGNFVLLAIWVSFLQWLFESLTRDMFPWWADSIAIPITYSLVQLAFLVPVLSVCGYLIIRKRRLPVPLWAWENNSPIRMLVVTVWSGSYIGPLGAIIGIYLLLSTRAALVARSLNAG
jgi:hypothetical protein